MGSCRSSLPIPSLDARNGAHSRSASGRPHTNSHRGAGCNAMLPAAIRGRRGPAHGTIAFHQSPVYQIVSAESPAIRPPSYAGTDSPPQCTVMLSAAKHPHLHLRCFRRELLPNRPQTDRNPLNELNALFATVETYREPFELNLGLV